MGPDDDDVRPDSSQSRESDSQRSVPRYRPSDRGGRPRSEFGPPIDTGRTRRPRWESADSSRSRAVGWQPATPEDLGSSARYRSRPSASSSLSGPGFEDHKARWRPDPLDTSAGLPRAGVGSLWDDDTLARALTPGSLAGEAHPQPWRRIIAILGAAVAAVVLIGGVVAVILVAVSSGGGHTKAKAPARPPAVAAPPAPPALLCPNTSGNTTAVVGNGMGGTDSGAAAILGFQHAFYVERSGMLARSFVAADSPTVSPPEVIQQAIDQQVPRGTSYCVRAQDTSMRAEPGAGEIFYVDVTQHNPNGAETVYKQQVVVVVREGRYLIFDIRERV